MPKISRNLRKEADEALRVGTKVYDYRRDVLEPERRDALYNALDAVRTLRGNRNLADESPLRAAVDKLENEMRQSGGTYYPRNALCENFEVFLVAAILAIGIRMFFIQPFRIPTNSMYPTYNGMTYELFEKAADRPSMPARMARAVVFGSENVQVLSPCDGEVVLPVYPTSNPKYRYAMSGRGVRARKWFGLLPEVDVRFTALVGVTPVNVDAPADFQMELMKALFKRFGNPTDEKVTLAEGGVWLYHTGVNLKKGEQLICFDVLMGDQLFVDRISYHFFRPNVGDPIVFRTDIIPGMAESERGKYYIKRLVGTPGDVLQVKEPVLYRNGKPITGAEAFDLNANRVGEYEGYLPDITQRDLVSLELPYTVQKDTYIGMGDNSDESADSRMWGPMPTNAVVGRALFIYYPFTRHVGLAK